MKRCPTCNREYDDELRFCLEDGTSLVTDGVAPTVAAPTVVYPTSEAIPPTITQAARPDVPPLPHPLAETTYRVPASPDLPNSSASIPIVVGVVLGLELLFCLVGTVLSGIFVVPRIPMMLFCLGGTILAMTRAKKYPTPSLMVSLALGLFLFSSFTALAVARNVGNFALYSASSVLHYFAYSGVIILLVAAAFLGRNSQSPVNN
jgi:hypothetical protein